MRIDFSRLNMEQACYRDCMNGNGFLITERDYADIDKSIRNMDGPRSPRFGTTYGDSNEFMDRYHCECGYLTGAAFEGDTCPKCGTKVEYCDLDILYTGWMNFFPYKIMKNL